MLRRQRYSAKLSHGFTIVELAVVIAVIGILAAIVTLTYGNYQARMRDNTRKNDLQQVATALKSYANWNGNYIELGSGCGSVSSTPTGSGNGWFAVNQSMLSTYAVKSILQCLVDAKLVDSDQQFIDPSGCRSDVAGCAGRGYMKATCQKAGVKVTYLFARLEAGGVSAAAVDGVCDDGTVTGFTTAGGKWGTSAGMNYYVKVD